MLPPWLPEIILLETYNGDWDRYLDAIYAAFQADFIGTTLQFQGKRVGLKRHPIVEGREATFWHFVSEGEIEADRLPDLRRCERIAWPRAIIDNCGDSCLKIWSEEVRGDLRVHVWCEVAEYLLILADRGDYVLPWTAYPVVLPHRKRKLQERWERATRNS